MKPEQERTNRRSGLFEQSTRLSSSSKSIIISSKDSDRRRAGRQSWVTKVVQVFHYRGRFETLCLSRFRASLPSLQPGRGIVLSNPDRSIYFGGIDDTRALRSGSASGVGAGD